MEGSRNTGRSTESNLQNYRMGNRLGSGASGKVKIAEHVLTGCTVAIKILKRQEIRKTDMEEKVRREIRIMSLLMHPHIIRLYEVIETNTTIYIVMECAKSGDLFDYIVGNGRLREDEARHFFQQIIAGVEYCHRNMIAHRDLKPENLLLDSNFNIKIADFGFGNIMQDGHFLRTSCGSPNYAAPEVISRELYAGPEVDVWSCGVILYALLCGTLPFDADNFPNLYRKIKAGIFNFPGHLSPLSRDLISRMLLVDPMRRINIQEIRQHPWFQAHLPRYLAVPPPDTMQQIKKIDQVVFQKVLALGFNRNELIESLSNRIQNQATVSYYLLLDNQFPAGRGNLSGALQETVNGVAGESSSKSPSSSMSHYLVKRPQLLPAEKKWALGLGFQAHPCRIMADVLKALLILNVCWKKIGHYNMRCRWFPCRRERMRVDPPDASIIVGSDGTAEKSSDVLKFELQLYKTKEEKYLLDLQIVSGPHLLFLDLCAAFLDQLSVIF